MKFNFYEGLHRIFILLSLIVAILIFISCGTGIEIWQSTLLGLFCGVCFYFLFFIVEWIIIGFANPDKIQETGLKTFFKKGIKKLVNVNYTKPFYFLLIMLIPLILIDVHNCSKTYEYNTLNDENKILLEKIYKLENKNEELYQQNVKLRQEVENQLPTWGKYKQRSKNESIEDYDNINKLSKEDIEKMDKLTGL